jgi:hypothetical protein
MRRTLALLGATKQLLAGGPATSTPDLLVTGRWKTTTGASGGDLPAGTGTDAVQALLTAVVRDDPLVLLGSLYYVWIRRTEALVPGDSAGVVLRVFLAATPSTSLLAGVDAAHLFAARSRGHSVAGTEGLSAILELGLSTTLARDLFLNVTTGIGVTAFARTFGSRWRYHFGCDPDACSSPGPWSAESPTPRRNRYRSS